MKKANCYVIVNCAEQPDFGGHFTTSEDVYAHYEKYDTFTQMVYSSLRAANRDANALDETVEDGEPCFVVCGVFCEQFSKDFYKRF